MLFSPIRGTVLCLIKGYFVAVAVVAVNTIFDAIRKSKKNVNNFAFI